MKPPSFMSETRHRATCVTARAFDDARGATIHLCAHCGAHFTATAIPTPLGNLALVAQDECSVCRCWALPGWRVAAPLWVGAGAVAASVEAGHAAVVALCLSAAAVLVEAGTELLARRGIPW